MNRGLIVALVGLVWMKDQVWGQLLNAEDEDFYPPKDDILSYQSLDSPFRIQKINLLWEKARRNLAEGKLQMLFSELKMQDKEELSLKRWKAEGATKDKGGLREAQVRKSFNGIMNKFGLSGTLPEEKEQQQTDKQHEHNLFKDKKLNKLWEKAEKSGLTHEELMDLKLEFRHHQEKVEQYNKLKEMSASLGEAGERLRNEIHLTDSQKELSSQIHPNEIDGKRKEVKASFQRLHRLATNTHEDREFSESKVEALWKLAKEADFNPDELESLREELHHYETRLHKIEFLKRELNLVDSRPKTKTSFEGHHEEEDEIIGKEENDDKENNNNKTEGRKIMDKKVRKHLEEAEKLEKHLERTIAARHSEL